MRNNTVHELRALLQNDGRVHRMFEGGIEHQLRTGSWGLDSFSQTDLLRTDKDTTAVFRHAYVTATVIILLLLLHFFGLLTV